MYLAFRFFVWDGNEKMTLLEFRRMFAWEMINNPEMVEAEETVRRSKRCRNVATEHSMQTAPKHARQDWDKVDAWSKKGIPTTHLFW